MLSVESYPDGTDKILVGLYKLDPSFGGTYDNKDEIETNDDVLVNFPTRAEIADWTGLSKQDVRYRLDKLVDNGVVIAHRVDDGHGTPSYHYHIAMSGVEFVRSTTAMRRVLGEVPGNVRVEHLRELAAEVEQLREELDAVGGLDERVEKLSDRLDELQDDDADMESVDGEDDDDGNPFPPH
ncbi:hypothetical protein [Halobaculum roseum]|uniref:Winged helix-turn-helix transcriptional regulator n=1 Tax=Halobaculum roseum TaxID=2175149 RepID=A0ABD5MR76_9EURY|nr:hypothetical protein [Halobaculum roseum]QZY04216.1 hypothetical protein K6T36_16000 [Halobaculum roseum]